MKQKNTIFLIGLVFFLTLPSIALSAQQGGRSDNFDTPSIDPNPTPAPTPAPAPAPAPATAAGQGIEKSTVTYPKIKGMIATLNIGKAKKPADIIGKAIKLVMGIVGAIALVMFVYAGGLWMVAGGNAQQTTKALKTMVWSAIGLIVILSSYSIVNFIFTNTF